MKNKKQRKIMLYLMVILGVTIGFALLSTTLFINGTASIKSNTWNIHWDDTSVSVSQGSVSASAPSVTTTTSTKDTVSFDVEFEMPGDFYEFEIDAINEGSVDGALQLSQNWITYKSNGSATTLPSYMDFKVVYDDNTTPANGDVLTYGTSQTYKIRVEFKSGVEELPENPQPITIEVSLPYVQHKVPAPNSFSTDSWETIANNPTSSKYQVGDTKEVEIDLDEDGTKESYTVRLENKTTPSACADSNYSQSACGFVVAFDDILTLHRMNRPAEYYGEDAVYGLYNKGGWEYSEMRTFVNHDLYDKFPSSLKKVIKSTRVISGHGFEDPSNFNTTDKLYLLAPREVWGENPDNHDSAFDNTRQLDYYYNQGVTLSNTAAAVKTYNGNGMGYWLRTARSDKLNEWAFYYVSNVGEWGSSYADGDAGVAPAFRIG